MMVVVSNCILHVCTLNMLCVGGLTVILFMLVTSQIVFFLFKFSETTSEKQIS